MVTKSKAEGNVVDIDVASEMQGSFLEYAYSVIYSRALPDARDGLKPVQRRILHTMANMGLRSDRGHVKSARVVGEVMGKLHPHGDSAIYDALVRMAQSWSLRLPFIDGHGNFGSIDEGPAAYRYTEARLATAASCMVDSLDEDVVDFSPNYDGRELEPSVLPAAIPNLLVNGASGIAVGMATNMPPHNLGETVNAAIHLLNHPKASLEELMEFVPGPDLPTGGIIVGLDGITEAYATGKGSLRIRAKVDIQQVSAKRMGLVVRELPYQVGTERVIERIKDLVTDKKLQGISDIIDLTDYESGLELVIELKHGFNPAAVLDQLYKLTPLEDSFHINNVALVNGQPMTLGLKPLLEVFLAHRLEVVRRRSEFRRNKANERLHLVDGLLIAILDIDEVIAVIRSSDDTAAARERLIKVFELSEIQANYILEMPLRRLTKFSRIELEKEQSELQLTISDLTDILENEKRLKKVVGTELKEVADKFGDERRTVLLDDEGAALSAPVNLEIADDPCYVFLSATGLIARTNNTDNRAFANKRASHDTIRSGIDTTIRGDIGVITSLGRVLRIPVVSLPALADNGLFTVAGGSALKELVPLGKTERPLALMNLAAGDSSVFLATALGMVKRVIHDVPSTASDWNIIRLEQGDYLVGATQVSGDLGQVVLITDDAQLLRFKFSTLRAAGRPAGGVAGIKLAKDAKVIFGAVVPDSGDLFVGTVAGDSDTLPGTAAHSMKVTPLSEFPPKGRATGGVRCHKFLSGENSLVVAVTGVAPLHACTGTGGSVELPTKIGKRDGSGSPVSKPVVALGAHPLGG
ncbi:MAG: DNA topoisomerase IV subunit A [Actinomycetales bacterium]|nr:DNA topoisomerase IV subunit A [Actinomycetales bacterium]